MTSVQTVDDIIAHCRAHLAPYKVPRYVVFTEVPKTSTGKIQKSVLRERAKGAARAPDNDQGTLA